MFKSVTNYFRESYAELRKVTWPTRQQTIADTIKVIALSIAVAVFLGTLDYIFNFGLSALLAGF
jgi:preprotein translocase subunit SecE